MKLSKRMILLLLYIYRSIEVSGNGYDQIFQRRYKFDAVRRKVSRLAPVLLHVTMSFYDFNKT